MNVQTGVEKKINDCNKVSIMEITDEFYMSMRK